MGDQAELHSEDWDSYCEFDGGDYDECICRDPESWESACPDDLCHGGEVPCMHGSYSRLPCPVCSE